MVGAADQVVVVLDDHQRVSLVAQPVQDRDQPADLLRMEAGCGLVEHVERVDQARAQSLGQVDRWSSPPRGCGRGGRASGSRARSPPGSRAGLRPGPETVPLRLIATQGFGLSSKARSSRIVMAESSAMSTALDLDGQGLGPQPGAVTGRDRVDSACHRLREASYAASLHGPRVPEKSP